MRTVARAYYLNGKKRPPATTVIEVMENLQTDGLGKLKTIGTTRAFYKTTPCDATDDALQTYSITRNTYLDKFNERVPVAQISKDLFNRLLEQAENKDNLRIYGIEVEA